MNRERTVMAPITPTEAKLATEDLVLPGRVTTRASEQFVTRLAGVTHSIAFLTEKELNKALKEADKVIRSGKDSGLDAKTSLEVDAALTRGQINQQKGKDGN